MTELDVINDALSTMGEVPLNDADELHPMVPQIQRFLREENMSLQQQGWWFNQEYVTLTPDALSSFIYVPNDTIIANPVNKKSYRENFIQRGKRLYNTDTNTYVFSDDVEVILTRLIPFEDMPVYAQKTVATATCLRFQQAHDADQTRAQLLMNDRNYHLMKLEQEDIRIRKPNMLYKNTTLRTLNGISRGRRPWLANY